MFRQQRYWSPFFPLLCLLVFTNIVYIPSYGTMRFATPKSALPTQLSEWRLASPLNIARLRHGSVSLGSSIYVIGGQNRQDGSLKNVERSIVNSTGKLGPWQTLSPLPEDRNSFGVVTYNSYIYIVGGESSTGVITQVLYTRVLSDGSLDSWKYTSALPFRRSSPTVVAAKGYVFVIGGDDQELPPLRQNSVMRAKINTDGSLTAWQEVASLNIGRAYFAASTTSDFIYAVGGQNNTAASLRTVERAKINDDGTLGDWIVETVLMQRPRCDLATTINNGYLYALGGGSCVSSWYNSVERAKINDDGSLNSWEYVAPMTASRYFHTAESIGNSIYVIGGGNDVGEILNSTEQANLLQLLYLPLVRQH